jgi:hypothetical protein
MKIRYISEPDLEFGNGYHICPRTGISYHNVFDTRLQIRKDKITIGAIGTDGNLKQLRAWLDRCAKPITAKQDSSQPNLFVGFCGVNKESGFKSEFLYGDEITRDIRQSEVKRLLNLKSWNTRVSEAAAVYFQEIKFLAQNRPVDVIVCVLPNELYDSIAHESSKPVEETIEDVQADNEDNIEMNFRRLLKAKTMHLGIPIQIIRELSLESNVDEQQDDATKAWNFCVALYYKANRTVPWKLVRNINRPSVCFVGIGFYRSRDKQTLHTSLAQIFDELGNSVILRGTPVELDKEDRQPHLSTEQSLNLLNQALEEYKIALGTMPARLVVHKSSNYNPGELEGFHKAANNNHIGSTDFVTILDSDMRLLRKGEYPPYRGMDVELDSQTHLLYTRGFVPFYGTYPGKYIPQPIEVRIVEADTSPELICDEIVSLTKMNWNNTQFDGKYPITIECARRVGKVMKYLKEHDRPQISYSFYM